MYKKLTYRVLASWKKQHGLHVASRMFNHAMESGEWTLPKNVQFEYCDNTTYVMYEKPEKGTYNTVSLLSKI